MYTTEYLVEQYNLAIAICSKIGDTSGVYKYARLLGTAVGASTLRWKAKIQSPVGASTLRATYNGYGK